MSERTTIGGVAYETVGSSSSNLLLRCNGTARIQWGSKLIDLIKDGKIATSSDTTTTSEQVFVVNDESEIKSDGVYVVNKEDTSQLWVSKDGTHYNLSGTELYISASKKQEITDEQKLQAIENLGLYHNTLEEAKASGIKNGFVYILTEKKLYTVTNGSFEEFQATLKTVSVEQEQEQEQEIGDVINSSIQIVLSISDLEHLVISNQRIVSNYSIYIKDTASLNSENYAEGKGYKLYMNKLESNLDIDNINSRKSIVSSKVSSENADLTKGFQLYTEGETSYLNVDHINAREWTPFSKGMIMMFDGKADIPEGWAICDGKEHEYKGNKFITPNLIGRFIKAVETEEEVGAIDQEHLEVDNTFTLTSEHLPEHSHPHNAHSHNISDIIGDLGDSGDLSGTLTDSNYVYNVSSDTVEVITTVTGQDISTSSTQVASNVAADTQGGTSVGGNHTHSLIISGGNISETQSEEAEVTWENKPFKIEPNAYALIFIIKL